MSPPPAPALVGGRLRPASVGDAVAAARAALPGWSGLPVAERGRVLHELAEALDDVDPAAADRALWYAGWTDKITEVTGGVAPTTGPSASWSTPRPVGVVGVLASGPLLDVVDALGAVLAAGATAVVVGSAAQALVLPAASTLPPGVANLVPDGAGPELVRAAVDGLDAAGDAEIAAGPGVRVLRPGPGDRGLARLRAWTEVTTVWLSAGR